MAESVDPKGRPGGLGHGGLRQPNGQSLTALRPTRHHWEPSSSWQIPSKEFRRPAVHRSRESRVSTQHRRQARTMNGRESRRPAPKTAAAVELERLARQLGAPDQGLFEAASETLHGTSDAVDLSAIPKFVEESAEVCIAAHARWRACTPEQRALLRGCSIDLIGLTVDQCLRLDRSFAEYHQSEVDVRDAGENLASALERAENLAKQARSVIQTVSGVPQLGVPAEGEDPVATFSGALQGLRDTAHELLERGSPGARKRCTLYALDRRYVQMLDATLSALGELAQKASDAAAIARNRVQVERTLARARPLVEQLVQAFEHAGRLDRNIAPVRARAEPPTGKRAAGDAKGRGALETQKSAVMKPAPPATPRHVEKLVLGSGIGGDHRFKR